MKDTDITKLIDERIKKIVPEYLKQSAFTDRKLTDTPTDSLQVVNRKFVTLNGVTTSRPLGSILGQFYFDTDEGFPVWWSGTTWVRYDGNAA